MKPSGDAANSSEAIYLGIDPSLSCTGYAVLQPSAGQPKLVEGGVVRSNRKDSLAKRVHEIATGIGEVIEEYCPKSLAIEQVFSFGKNPKTALMLAHARGAILHVATEFKVPVLHFTPTQIKRLLTGSGRASKEQIQHAVQNELRLPDILEPNDVADATAIALCMYHSVRFAA